MTISDSLTGRRALVTGGSKGQGAAIVARLREAGALVMTTARTQPENDPHPDLFITADVATAAGAQTVLDGVRTRLEPLTSWCTSSAAPTHLSVASRHSATNTGRKS